MCTTRRYIFLCGHPATHRFRDSACATPSVHGCSIKDYNIHLRHPCRPCRLRGCPSRAGFPDEPEFVDEWHVPRRCFVDVGFQTLDPFGAQRGNSSDADSSSSLSSSMDTSSSLGPSDDEKDPELEEELVSPTTTVAVDSSTSGRRRSLYRRFVERLSHPKRGSPCCEQSATLGAYQATRVEGRDNRVDGVISDSGCFAWQ